MSYRRTVFAALMCLLLAVLAVVPARAQDRLPPIPPERQTEAQKKAAAEFRVERMQEVFGPFVPLSRSPQLMIDAAKMGTYLRFGNTLPRALSEFAIILQARRWSQEYEWYVHAADARTAGLPDDVIQAVAEGRRPETLAADEEAVYAFCDELQRNQSVSDATYARAVAALGEQGVVDTVCITGYYTLLAMMLNTARTPLPPGATPGLTPFPR